MNLELDFTEKKPAKAIHPNSTLSHRQQKERGQTEHFRRRIWEILRDANRAMTDRELMDVLSEDDVNNVRPEVTRLKQDGLISEVGKTICKWTGKKVRQTVICSTAYRPHQKQSQE